MKWEGRRKSSNVSDQRGSGTGGGFKGGKTAATGGIGLIAALVLFLVTGNSSFLGDLFGGGQVALRLLLPAGSLGFLARPGQGLWRRLQPLLWHARSLLRLWRSPVWRAWRGFSAEHALQRESTRSS